MNKKLIAPIVAAGAMLLTSVGSTFALFTSKASSEINIQAGKVNVGMNISNFKTYSGKWNSETTSYDLIETENNTFSNGGTASIEGDVLSLNKVSPMDKVEFDVSFTNGSNIDTKVRLIKEVILNDGLFEGLEVKFGDEIYDGMTDYGEWVVVEPAEAISGYHVSAYLPELAGNEYQEKTCKIRFGIEAIQANAYVETLPEDADLGIYNANDLMIYGRGVEAGNAKYTHKTAVLMNDIDMAGLEWAPVNVWSKGITFDGLEHTISNLKIKDGYHGSGFFTGGNTLLMKNVKFDNASVTGIGQVGIAVGNGDCARLENITVTNSSVKAVVTNNDDGDKAGAIVGYLCHDGGTAYLKNSKVEGCTVEGYRDVGGAVGIANGPCIVENVDVKNTTIVANKLNNYKNYTTDDEFDIHEVIGETTSSAVVNNISFENVEIENMVPCTPSDIGQKVNEASDGDVIALTSSTEKYVLPQVVNKELTFVGDAEHPENVKVDNSTALGMVGATLNFNGVTLCGITNESYVGYQHINEEYYENCVFTGFRNFYGNKTTVKNCTFKDGPKYFFWVYNTKGIVTFEGCKFESSNGYAAKIYNESTDSSQEVKVIFKDCIFNAPENNPKNKPAIAVALRGLKYDITISNCVATNFKVAEDDAMDSWYQTRMANATFEQKMLIGCEVNKDSGTQGSLVQVKVNIDGNIF